MAGKAKAKTLTPEAIGLYIGKQGLGLPRARPHGDRNRGFNSWAG